MKNGIIIKVGAVVLGLAVLFGGSFFIATLIEKKFSVEETIEGAGEAISRTEIEASNSVRESVLEDATVVSTMEYNGHTYAYNDNIDVLLIIAVSHLLYDVEISNYFALTMDSIPIINDSVGGVTVTIQDDFSKIDESLVKGETVTLMGDQAEHYVRGRRSIVNDPTNINRMKRQRDYMTKLLPILGKKTSESNSFAFELFDKLSDYMITDCTYDQLSSYISQFSGYKLDKIISPDGRSVAGEEHMEFYVDQDSLKSIVIDLFYVQQD